MNKPNIDGLADGDIDAIFETLATALDDAGPDQEAVFLAKLVLLMARDLGDLDHVTKLIDEARGSYGSKK